MIFTRKACDFRKKCKFENLLNLFPEPVRRGVQSGGREEEEERGDGSSDSSSDDEDDDGSEIETPSEEDGNVVGGDSAQRSSSRTSKVGSSILIGPSYSNIPIRYHSKVSYQSYVGDILQRLRGGGARGVVFPDWMPCSSDWAEIPQRFVLLQGSIFEGS